ncbi:MAG: Pyruvate/Phosphoenolpyruvate kinase-like domain-containing protein [Monoraphidium minutum]|nr:MAG: Pyruvate/Phosphoenolpyruvate kinase-like domain-containing protein [Monoraphidium minutum]
MARASRTDKLRQLLKGPEIIKGPCCHDALSAKLIEQAGFDFAFMSGFCTSAARLGSPDTGLISYYEMMDQGRYCHEATRAMPIIGDGDTGYGNAVNVKRTVKGYAAAGFAGILIEDQVSPKSCGHVRNKRVVPREEAVSRIRAAVDARNEGADILIVARTDARQAAGLDEALWRARAFAEAGADVLFIDALASVEEMRAFCDLGGAAAGVPKMANMLEGGGKTPLLSPEELQAMGFSLVAYPLSLLGVSIRAMQDALRGLKSGRVPGPREMGTFVDIQMAVGFPEYYAEEDRYALSDAPAPPAAAAPPPPMAAAAAPPPPPAAGAGAAGAGAPSSYVASPFAPTEAGAGSGGGGAEVVVPTVLEPSGRQGAEGGAGGAAGAGAAAGGGGYERPPGGEVSEWVRISDSRTKLAKLETRIPANFIGSLATMVPQIAGVDLDEMLRSAMGGKLDLTEPLVNYETGTGDVVQIWLEQ